MAKVDEVTTTVAAERGARRPKRVNGYLPIEDYAAIGDRATTALVGLDGSIDWLCLPRHDSPFPFSALLDSDRGGRFALAPRGEFRATRSYVPMTNVLETTFHAAGGRARVTDAMTLDAAGKPLHQLVRVVEGLDGEVELQWRVAPRFGGRHRPARIERRDGRHLAAYEGEGVSLQLLSGTEPRHVADGIEGELTLRRGERALLVLSPAGVGDGVAPASTAEQLLSRVEQTASWWRDYAEGCSYEGPWREAVLRSGLVLKLLVDATSGAVVAAPTTGLPEALGGSRNWDYRYCWLRDASFAIDALLHLGDEQAARRFFKWLIRASCGEDGRLQPFYRLDGSATIEERLRGDLDGYRGSQPVREGNGAVSQRQLGNYGDVLHAAALYAERGHDFSSEEGERLAALANHVCEAWTERDSGIWELGTHLHYTSSKMLCWVALDRACQLAGDGKIPSAHASRWRQTRERVGELIEGRCFSAHANAYSRAADSDELDAAVALAAFMRYDVGERGRLSATLDAISRELARGPLVYRYSGMEAEEGTFLACAFWRVHALARLGRLDEAEELMNELVTRGNDVGLYSEEMDPESGAMLGNFPQALTHLALVNAAVAFCESSKSQ